MDRTEGGEGIERRGGEGGGRGTGANYHPLSVALLAETSQPASRSAVCYTSPAGQSSKLTFSGGLIHCTSSSQIWKSPSLSGNRIPVKQERIANIPSTEFAKNTGTHQPLWSHPEKEQTWQMAVNPQSVLSRGPQV